MMKITPNYRHILIGFATIGFSFSAAIVPSWAGANPASTAEPTILATEEMADYIVVPALKKTVSETSETKQDAGEPATVVANLDSEIQPSEAWSFLMWEEPRHTDDNLKNETVVNGTFADSKPAKRHKAPKYRFRSVRRQTMSGLI